MLARMKLDPARMELLAAFFETYLKLNREEEEQLYRELGKMDKKEKKKMDDVLRALAISVSRATELESFLREKGVVAAYLFGSRATGENQEESDLDLALLLPSEDGYSASNYYELYSSLADFFYPLELDLVILNQAPLDLAFEIIANGRLIFCFSEDACTDYEDRLIRDYLDFSVELELYYQEVKEEMRQRAAKELRTREPKTGR